MALEIERRFLVRGGAWRDQLRDRLHAETAIRQGYLATGEEGLSLRVRLARPLGRAQSAFLTLKAPAPPEGRALARLEFEYPIPVSDGEALLALAAHGVVKTRFALDLPGGDWVLDVFEGANAPLVVAEVELERGDRALELPVWCATEITDRRDLSNASLARRPLADWPAGERDDLLATACGGG
ncbi:MAG: adenylate cyclase [Cyanobium sp. CACIAM 14]|nr:MAG: adenylate cyclase [Cyanobium sp. CACIAM 14]